MNGGRRFTCIVVQGNLLHRLLRRQSSATTRVKNTVPFKLTDIGEGIAEVELLKWFIKVQQGPNKRLGVLCSHSPLSQYVFNGKRSIINLLFIRRAMSFAHSIKFAKCRATKQLWKLPVDTPAS